jgi:hypothetical protein
MRPDSMDADRDLPIRRCDYGSWSERSTKVLSICDGLKHASRYTLPCGLTPPLIEAPRFTPLSSPYSK